MKLIEVSLVALLMAVGAAESQQNTPVAAELAIDPGMDFLDAWSLSIQTNGVASFSRMFSGKTNALVFSAAQMARLAELVATNGFLNSGDTYGEQIVDASTRKIRITSGARSKTVEILGLHNWALPHSPEHKRLPEVVPALQVWDEIEAWIHEDKIIRFREWDAKDIESARNLQPTGPRDGVTVGIVFKKAQVDVVAAFYFDLTGNKVEVEPGVYATVSLRTEWGVTKGEAVRLVEEALREQNVGLFPKAPNLFAARWIDPAIRPQGPPFGVSSSTSSVPSTTTNSHTRMSHITRRAERERTRKGSKGLAQQTNVVHKATTQPSGTNSPIHPILNPEQVGTELRTDSLPGSFPQK